MRSFQTVTIAVTLAQAALLMQAGFGRDAHATEIPPGPVAGTWDLAGSPYIVMGDIFVPSGGDLAIEPGVEVEFAGAYGLTLQGTLTALGTAAMPIQIRGTVPWSGLRFENPDLISQLSYCWISGATEGVASILSPIDIRDCELSEHEEAIHVFGVGDPEPPPVTIRGCVIHTCQQHGIFVVENSNTTIEGCEIHSCALDGSPRGAIQLSNQSSQGRNDPILTGNWIHDNVWQGLTAFDVTGAGRIAPTVTDNMIEYNYTGVYLLYASGTFHGNQINHNFQTGNPNSGAGVMVYGATARPVFTANTTRGNFTGYYVIEGAAPNLGDVGNADPNDDGRNRIFGNVDPGGHRWSVYSNSTADIMAENNIWDSEDYGEIAATIFDGNDDPAYGIVDFDPILPLADVSVGEATRGPATFRASPNPFSDRTRIHVLLSRQSARASDRSLRVVVLDPQGRRVRTLAGGRDSSPQTLGIDWNGTDDRGRALPSGIYWLYLDAAGERASYRVVVRR